MTLSYRVHLPAGQTIGVSDDAAGDRRLEELFKKYGDCTVEVYDRNDVFGRGFDQATPMLVSTIKQLFEE